MLGIRRDYKPNAKIEFPMPQNDSKHTVRDAIADLEDIEPSKSFLKSFDFN